MTIVQIFLLSILTPGTLALGGWLWNTNVTIATTQQNVRSLGDRVTTFYQEGSIAFRQHLQEEAASDQQLIYVQQQLSTNTTKLEAMNDKLTDMLLLQRDLLNAVKERSPNIPHSP